LTATATHDTKRGEDARARILAISELASDWDAAVRDWASRNAAHVQHTNGKRLPSRAHEYMIYQALIGAWPGAANGDFVRRMQAYALKAAREGKQNTSWTDPNETYESALNAFVERLLDSQLSAGFLSAFDKFAQRTALLGALTSLSQLALKAMLPGVPDFYQGTELWDLSLVDPDNRRPVDFSRRTEFLNAREADWAELASDWRSGRIKFQLTRKLLQLRAEWPAVFQQGNYQPLAVTGPHREHVIAFSRGRRNQQLIVAVGRHFAALTGGGGHWPQAWDARLDLPSGSYEPVLSPLSDSCSGSIALSDLFSPIPVAILVSS
ncbi:MAG TPA: hypothetical protein VFG44_09545, partial [Burkholderiales bacterium]|nr:hypothetical protein [Burkholderiales bacterium]